MRRKDERFLAQALALAALGEGTTRPNPQVGCVVVREGRVVGTGYHRAAGEPHAELTALREAGEAARGATLYVSLEPCAHHGRTPPCAAAIVAAGVRRVVAAVRDPNPLVDGRGLAELRGAGIVVETGLLEREARALNAPFFSIHEHGRPFVTLKAAVSLDGRVAAMDGSSTWVTGTAARRYAHRLRMTHGAVLVGAETVRRDDPRLTVRLPGVAAEPLRIVLARRLDLSPDARVFARSSAAAAAPRVYTARGAPEAARRRLEAVADVVAVDGTDRGLDLAAVLADLAGAGVQSVLVEGGGRTLGAFLEAGLADAVALFTAPRLVGDVGATALLDVAAAASPDAAASVVDARRLPLGADELLTGRIARDRCSPA